MTLNSYKYKTMRYNTRKNASCVGIQSHGRVWLRVDSGWVTPQCIKLDKNLIYGSAQQKNGEETHILICNFFFLILSFIDGVYAAAVSLSRFLYYSRNVLGLFLMDV